MDFEQVFVTITNMNKSYLLIVEDDPSLRVVLAKHLEPYFEDIDTCSRLESAFEYVAQRHYEIALIDRILPDGDGIDLAEYLFTTSLHTKPVIISHLSQVAEKVKGLEVGAFEYLAKPLSPIEIKLRIQKLLQLNRRTAQTIIHSGGLELDIASGQVTIKDFQVQLRRKESLLLSCLLQHAGSVVSREVLLRTVWGSMDEPLSSTLDVYIRRIRSKLGPYAKAVRTLRGFGYSFSLELVTEVPSASPFQLD